MNIFNVNSGANDPAPGFEPSNIGYLGDDSLWVVFPLPLVVHIASSGCLNDLDELDEEPFTAGIGKICDVLSFQVGSIRMHDQMRMHVIDPEVVFFLRSIPQGPQGLNGLGAGDLARYLFGEFFFPE